MTACFFVELMSVLLYDLLTRRRPYWQTVVATLAVLALMPLSQALSGTTPMLRLLGWVLKA